MITHPPLVFVAIVFGLLFVDRRHQCCDPFLSGVCAQHAPLPHGEAEGCLKQHRYSFSAGKTNKVEECPRGRSGLFGRGCCCCVCAREPTLQQGCCSLHRAPVACTSPRAFERCRSFFSHTSDSSRHRTLRGREKREHSKVRNVAQCVQYSMCRTTLTACIESSQLIKLS